MKFKARTTDERKLDVNWDHINEYVRKWKPGTLLDIRITRKKTSASDPFRAFYFKGILPPFMETLGYSPDELEQFHRSLKCAYFNVKPDKRGIYRNIPSVFSNEPDVDPDIRQKYVDWVMRKAAEYGCYIESP